MNKVNIGSVGLGRLGLRHAENIAGRIQNARLAALCDVDEAKLRETAGRLGVSRCFTSFEEMIASKDIDAVVLVSPSGLHTKQIAAALAAGKHVFSEKPLGVSVAECREA
ncbi:MAG: Gfo/Idh/MocA family oxidoreductase, partial [Spirochaetaceae bacterium]|nr:Gfo/Idh/MocA family oxidoreductase [Spirochaetaceae bacterium]